MYPTYETRNKEIAYEHKDSVHVPPHLHEAMEIVFVTEGSVELGVGKELYHLDKGDFGIVFPNVIHHYQVFSTGKNKAIYIFIESSFVPNYFEKMQKYSPIFPIIRKEKMQEDMINSIYSLINGEPCNTMIAQAHVQVMLAHVFSDMEMIEKDTIGGDDIIYNVVEYVAKNFKDEICLDKMALELGVSKYVLSRLFAKTFHCNFNKYVNGVRLNYATTILENTYETITNICLEAGFESQRTFNRVFKERYKMTPREYRKSIHMIKDDISIA